MFNKLLFLLLIGMAHGQQCVRPSTTRAPTTTSFTTKTKTTTSPTTTAATTTKKCLPFGSFCNATSDCCSSNDATFRYLPACAEVADGYRCVCNFAGWGCVYNEPCCNGLPCDPKLVVCPAAVANDFCLAADCDAPLKCAVDPAATAVAGGWAAGKCI